MQHSPNLYSEFIAKKGGSNGVARRVGEEKAAVGAP